MKKTIVLFAAVFAISTFNAFATNNETTMATQSENSWNTCQFSLSHYTGVISENQTDLFYVRLNCPQQADVYATVFVVIDGRRVASEVVKISAGKTESNRAHIVCTGYNGKNYTLEVE